MNSDLQLFKNGVSRRSFLRTLGAAGAAAAALPSMAYGQQVASNTAPPAARRGMSDMGEFRQLPPDAVIISSNENPLGPHKDALDAICATASLGGRYHQEVSGLAVKTFTEAMGLPMAEPGKPGMVALFPGSGGPLDLALMSNIGPDKPLVFGDPSYEQGPRAAQTMKAARFPVPLTATYAHDVKAMIAAHPSPGAYYIVNPNNPTGTMTPREDIIYLLENKPKGSVVIVDEAYFHFSNDESVVSLVPKYEDLIVTRTFSKIYGMAGLRAGVAIAHPERLQAFANVAPPARSVGSISITSAAAVTASLLNKDLVPQRRKINADVRAESIEFLSKQGYKIIPGSQANFFMVDTGANQMIAGQRGGPFQQAMIKEKVAIGRTWDALPTYVRITVGTHDEMQKFQTAFVKCMDTPTPGTPIPAGAAELYLPEYYAPSELHRGWA
jgi:histidinol-phosphate aminotransferase